MKKVISIAASLAALAVIPVFGQNPPPTMFSVNNATGQPIPNAKPQLIKFNLHFRGGTPSQLVAAIEKAMGKPLNAIIPPDDENVELPPLKMNNVDVAQLFDALEPASVHPVVGLNRYGNGYQTGSAVYGFKTRDMPPTDDSVWYFFQDGALPPPLKPAPICRYYLLTPYLDKGMTVDDITTAIQTGWKMMGVKPMPELSFHKETKLLIAVGEPDKLETIDAVLKALKPTEFRRVMPPGFINPQTGLPMAPGKSVMRPDINPATGLPMAPEKPMGNN